MINHVEINDEMYEDEIVSITEVGIEETIDIETDGNHLFFANGILTHNSGVGLDELDHSNISGGISKINTADMVFGIITNNEMRENGSYELQVLKSRNSAGTGRKIPMKINPGTMRIVDDPEYIAKIGQYLKMNTQDANKDRHKSEVQSEYDKLMEAIKPPKSEASDDSYGSNYSNGMASAEPLSGEQPVNKPKADTRMTEIKNLINKSMR